MTGSRVESGAARRYWMWWLLSGSDVGCAQPVRPTLVPPTLATHPAPSQKKASARSMLTAIKAETDCKYAVSTSQEARWHGPSRISEPELE
eukprot:COSAG01_NODE_11293_length_1964_cov_70.975335_3_plen_91_part_00